MTHVTAERRFPPQVSLRHPETPTPSGGPLSAIHRPLSGHELPFRLEEQAAELLASDACLRTGRSARTLVKEGALRVTLVAVAPAGGIAAHSAEGPITVQGIAGEVVVRVDGGREHRIGRGDLLALGPAVRHAVESRGGGAFLLTAVASRGEA